MHEKLCDIVLSNKTREPHEATTAPRSIKTVPTKQ